jgi:Transglycosylase associated protein
MEASVDSPSRGPDWMPITPKTGSLLHAETQLFGLFGVSLGAGWLGYLIAGFIGAVFLVFVVRAIRERA